MTVQHILEWEIGENLHKLELPEGASPQSGDFVEVFTADNSLHTQIHIPCPHWAIYRVHYARFVVDAGGGLTVYLRATQVGTRLP